MYQILEDFEGILRQADQARIPSDNRNKDWLEYQTWLGLGNTPDPAYEPPIEIVQNEHKYLLDIEASRLRSLYKSLDKDSTYIMKSLQVDTFITEGYPSDLTGYGYIKAELSRIGLDNSSLANRQAAANSIISIRNQWLVLDALIEEIVLTAKAALDTKNTKLEIKAVFNSAKASLALLKPGT